MRLTYICSSCKKQNYLSQKADDRAILQKQLSSDEIQVNCNSCGKMEKKHLNKIVAVVDNRLVFLGIPLGIIATVILISFFGLIATITFSIPIYVWSYEQKKAHQFNLFRIRK
ncbi:hypothetical protein [Maribacter sp. 2308TA10-17]|uniref:hypothetical protein n=1 Tax=Maribacter sp. 2308TA10-17 TaxID=3386276 RepID=UPI0039BC26C3